MPTSVSADAPASQAQQQAPDLAIPSENFEDILGTHRARQHLPTDTRAREHGCSHHSECRCRQHQGSVQMQRWRQQLDETGRCSTPIGKLINTSLWTYKAP